jgi:NAD+-dependent secondary alcohol dehydrogenase Adh1
MKAVRVHEYGKPPSIDDVPEPTISGPLDIIVKIDAAGLCRTDLHIIDGQWASRSGVTLPYILGHENAGTVVEVGSAVTTLERGDAVILHPNITCGLCPACRRGDDVHCENKSFPGLDRDGGMAEYLLTSARSAVKLGEGVLPMHVAALADAGLTAHHAVRKAVPLLPATARAVIIGLGGLGHIGLQCALALTGAEVIALDRNEEVLHKAEVLGAHRRIRYDDNAVAAVLDATDGKGAEVVFDFVGEYGTEAAGIAMTRDGGFYFVIGYGGKVEAETLEMISREISVIGNLVGSYTDLLELMALTERGQVMLSVKTYPLTRALDAISDLEAGRLPGTRAILLPAA